MDSHEQRKMPMGNPLSSLVPTAASGGATPFTNPIEWIKTPEDVVPLALFLAAQPDRGPTGQTFSLMRRDM